MQKSRVILNSIQRSVSGDYKLSEGEIVTKNLPFEVAKQKLINITKKIFPFFLSLGIGIATIPLNIIVHEYGHAIAGKFFNCNPIMIWEGPYLLSSRVFFKGCISNVVNDLGGPLAEIIAVLAVLRFSKSKYTPIALLPHLAHLAIHPLGPFLGTDGDYKRIYKKGGFIPYSIAFAVTLVPLALSILSLKRSFFSSPIKPSEEKGENNNASTHYYILRKKASFG